MQDAAGGDGCDCGVKGNGSCVVLNSDDEGLYGLQVDCEVRYNVEWNTVVGY